MLTLREPILYFINLGYANGIWKKNMPFFQHYQNLIFNRVWQDYLKKEDTVRNKKKILEKKENMITGNGIKRETATNNEQRKKKKSEN